MGLFTNALVEALRPQNKAALPIGAPTYPMIDLKTGEKKYAAGTDDAYFSNAFRACLLAKARPLASLPVDVYTRDEGTRVKAKSRVAKDLSRILRERWNPVLSSAEGIRWLIMTKDTLGNALLRVQWEKGRPVALWPLRMEAQPTVLPSGEVAFDYAGDKFTPEGRYLAYEIVWVKSPVLDADGYKGVSLADLAARELGLSIDLEEFYEKLVTNGNHFPGWLETDQTLGDQGVAALKKQLADKRGIVSAGELRIFDKGLKYHTTPLTMADMSLSSRSAGSCSRRAGRSPCRRRRSSTSRTPPTATSSRVLSTLPTRRWYPSASCWSRRSRAFSAPSATWTITSSSI